MSENRKRRAANFSSEECSALLALVKKYKEIVECKQFCKYNIEKKVKKWIDIEKEFNSKSVGCFRSAECLKKKYENIKKDTKKQLAAQKRSVYRTEGGSFQPEGANELDNTLLEVLGYAEELESCFDSDVGREGEKTAERRKEEDIFNADGELIDITKNDLSTEEVESGSDDNIITDKINKFFVGTKNATHLIQHKEPFKDRWTALAEKKIEKVVLEMRLMQEKHDLEMRLMKEEHDLKCKILKGKRGFLN